jgi:hypothetical protein
MQPLSLRGPCVFWFSHYQHPHQLIGNNCHPPTLLADAKIISIVPGAPWPEKQARAMEILEALSVNAEKRKTLWASLGYVDNEEETDELSDEQWELQRDIEALPVTTMVQAMAKVKAVAEIIQPYAEADGAKPEDDEEPGGGPDELAKRLIRDLARLAAS